MKEPAIIFENADVLVVDKPAGLLVHGEGEDATGTLVEWFLHRCPEASGVGEPRIGTDGEPLERSGIVHRLDRDTSGVMVLAKSQVSFDYLKDQFKKRIAKKEYRAIVYGQMKEKWGTINRRIGRSGKDWNLRSAEKGARGQLRDAVTDWECLRSGYYHDEPFSVLKLSPQTGRTHQLRVHLKSISRPIVGDNLYAAGQFKESNNLGLNRLALHAFRLELTMLDGQSQSFEAPVPEELVSAEVLIA